MAGNAFNLGRTQHKALTGVSDGVTIGNWVGVIIYASVDCHISITGDDATTSNFFLPAKAFPFAVNIDSVPNAAGPGGGAVHFIKATGAADGDIWITEAC